MGIKSKRAFYRGGYVLSALGFGLQEHIHKLRSAESGITKEPFPSIREEVPLGKLDTMRTDRIFASLFDDGIFTRFEKMALIAGHMALEDSGISVGHDDSIVILASTKGNIDLLEHEDFIKNHPERLRLWHTAGLISQQLGINTRPIVISNACISGLSAISTASRLIKRGVYKNVLVIGCDLLSHFIISGFLSFKSLDVDICKPFDAARKGLTIGEAAGAMVLSSEAANMGKYSYEYCGGGISNDANHISGPSRTGDGLAQAIKNSLAEASLSGDELDFISAHGTATPYNDEMEAKALDLCGLNNIPVNSTKGFTGHTMGAAAVIETVFGIQSMKYNELYPTYAYHTHGVSPQINIVKNYSKQAVNTFLKTASGFGGCNAAAVFKKNQANNA